MPKRVPLAIIVVLLLASPGRATEPRLSRPPDSAVGHLPPGAQGQLPPGAQEEVERLLKAAQGIRDKASDLRMQVEELRDKGTPQDEDEADTLEERAGELDEKADHYEDDADEIARTGGTAVLGPGKKGLP